MLKHSTDLQQTKYVLGYVCFVLYCFMYVYCVHVKNTLQYKRGNKDLYTWLLGYRTEISFLYRHNYCLTRKFRWICIFFYFKRKSTFKQSRKKHVNTENTAFQHTPVYSTYNGRLVSHVMIIWTLRSWVCVPAILTFN